VTEQTAKVGDEKVAIENEILTRLKNIQYSTGGLVNDLAKRGRLTTSRASLIRPLERTKTAIFERQSRGRVLTAKPTQHTDLYAGLLKSLKNK